MEVSSYVQFGTSLLHILGSLVLCAIGDVPSAHQTSVLRVHVRGSSGAVVPKSAPSMSQNSSVAIHGSAPTGVPVDTV